MYKVSLLKCDEYNDQKIKDTIIKSLENIDFDISSVNNKRIALKPNLLMPGKIEKAIITNPVFFKAVAEIVKDYNGKMVLIESPAIHSLHNTMKKVGYQEIIEKMDIEVADISKTKTIHNKEALQYKSIEIIEEFFNTDIIISMPKYKTHGLTYVTGAVKNMFGSISGMSKSQMHMKMPSNELFSNFLLDLYGAFQYGFDEQKPFVNIMDAIIGMEGDGPGYSGTPKFMGAVIAGQDAISVDYVATKAAGLDINKVYTIIYGFSRSFGASSEQDIQVIGNSIDDFSGIIFSPTENSILSHAVRWPFTSVTIKNLFTEKPVPDETKCTCCYQCQKICPAKAISKAKSGKKIPDYNYDKCIRCFCCMEICPEAAISVKKGLLQWIFR